MGTCVSPAALRQARAVLDSDCPWQFKLCDECVGSRGMLINENGEMQISVDTP